MTRVFVRIKPLLENDNNIVNKVNNKLIVNKNFETYDGINKMNTIEYNYNGIFDTKINNLEIFESIIKNNINNNFTCYMYGQTGSGKTHTVFGTDHDPGILLYIARSLIQENKMFVVSAYQIYNEEILDLLNSNNKLKIMENSNKKFKIPHLKYYEIKSFDVFFKYLNIINKNRTQASNNINTSSSRSHVILSFYYIKNNKKIKLRIIDLAGNERSKNSKITDLKSKQENKFINSSLFSLHL